MSVFPETDLSNAVPLIESGSGAVGTSGFAAREDHVHPLSPVAPPPGALLQANNLSDVQSASSSRANLGLGSAATHNTTEYEVGGAAAAVLALALQKASNLSDLSNVLAARQALGMGHVWLPSDMGFAAWTWDPVWCGTAAGIATGAGTLNLQRVHLSVSATITNLYMVTLTNGTGLTTGQCFSALFDASGNLLRQSVDQAANLATAGFKTMALSSSYAASPGDYYLGFWFNGTGFPTLFKGYPALSGGTIFPNVGLTAPNLRYCTTNSGGLTTTAPNPFGAQTAAATPWWMAMG